MKAGGHGGGVAESGFVHSFCITGLASSVALGLGNDDFAQLMDFASWPWRPSIDRAPRALAHSSPRRSAILECLSAPRALAGRFRFVRQASHRAGPSPGHPGLAATLPCPCQVCIPASNDTARRRHRCRSRHESGFVLQTGLAIWSSQSSFVCPVRHVEESASLRWA